MITKVSEHTGVYSTGRDAEGTQFVVGILLPDIVVFKFDDSGKYSGREVIPAETGLVQEMSTKIYRDDLILEELWNRVKRIKSSMCIDDSDVLVGDFFDTEYYVGPLGYPSEIEEFISNPQAFDDVETEELEAEIQDWRGSGYSVFCWAEEYWINSDGQVVAS